MRKSCCNRRVPVHSRREFPEKSSLDSEQWPWVACRTASLTLASTQAVRILLSSAAR
jgi:hypothetical protein